MRIIVTVSMMKMTYRYNPYKVISLTNKTELYGNRKRKKGS